MHFPHFYNLWHFLGFLRHITFYTKGGKTFLLAGEIYKKIVLRAPKIEQIIVFSNKIMSENRKILTYSKLVTGAATKIAKDHTAEVWKFVLYYCLQQSKLCIFLIFKIGNRKVSR